jgi:hypothetical protein
MHYKQRAQHLHDAAFLTLLCGNEVRRRENQVCNSGLPEW